MERPTKVNIPRQCGYCGRELPAYTGRGQNGRKYCPGKCKERNRRSLERATRPAYRKARRERLLREGRCVVCSQPIDVGVKCSNCSRQSAVHQRRRNRRIREQAIEQYGGKCACCGEHRYEFLAFDHINGDGGKHRREINIRSGARFCDWLRKNGWPSTIRLLCHNCNCSHGFHGYCPHEGAKSACRV